MRIWTRTPLFLSIAVAVFVTTGCQEDAMSIAEEDGIPTVIEQKTPSGAILVNREEALRLMLARTFPIRIRYLDAEGNVIHEAVVPEEGDLDKVRRQTAEALRLHSGRTREQVAAAKAASDKAADERFAAMWREALEERRKEDLDERQKEALDKLEKQVMEALGQRSK